MTDAADDGCSVLDPVRPLRAFRSYGRHLNCDLIFREPAVAATANSGRFTAHDPVCSADEMRSFETRGEVRSGEMMDMNTKLLTRSRFQSPYKTAVYKRCWKK